MGLFRRKKKDDSDQEQILRQIADGGAPFVASPPAQTSPAQTSPGQAYPPPGIVTSGAGAPMFSMQMPNGIDMRVLIAKSVGAISEHSDQLRARGLDPDQLVQMMQERLGSFGPDGHMFTVATTQVVAPGHVAMTGAPADDLVEQLQSISHLHETGALNDEEFAAAKTKLLANG